MIVVEFEDDQYGDLMKDIECFDEMCDKTKKIVKRITHLIGDNSMSMRGKYPKEDYYDKRKYKNPIEDEDEDYIHYNKRYM